jgi:hypothetical protein
MRAVFGVVSLLVVLAMVGLLAARQMSATGQSMGKALPAAAGSSSAAPAATVREQSQQIQQQVKSDVAKALEAGAAAARNAESDK